ncbi:MAG: hypothetical protein QM774_06885 [Gordonia sp. (in: high G+C Gram-positive bacteria)]|uniref:hypothetical protein n=1 Tax=Gordonia sp. (in: high G+C Gram-positive bacteria) TaxID=84139 RepID=UPI0039E47AC3
MDPLDEDLAGMPTLDERIKFTWTRRLFEAHLERDLDGEYDPEVLLAIRAQGTAEAIAALAAELVFASPDRRAGIAATRLSEPVHAHEIEQLHRELQMLDAPQDLVDVVTRSIPRWRWQDQQPDACQLRVHPLIKCDPDRWSLPAGWIGVVNELNQDLFDAIGPYDVGAVGQKLNRLRYQAVPAGGFTDANRGIVTELRDRAIEASRRTCSYCGRHRDDADPYTDRCTEHPLSTHPTHVRARLPGWR